MTGGTIQKDSEC